MSNNNELRARLLIEASDLLNEGARYRKELKDEHGKSSNDYGREAAKYAAKSLKSYNDAESKKDEAENLAFYKIRKKKQLIRDSEEDMNKRNNYNKNASNALYAGQDAAKKVKKDLERKSQNECIASLLIEASELLTESTRQDREERKKGIKNSKYWGDKAAKEEAIGKKLAKDADSLYDEADKVKWYKFKTKDNLRNKADDIYDEADEHCGNAFDARYNGRIAAKKAKKAQNESVDLASLLIEAADLLNESTRQDREAYNKGEKNSKYWGKEAAKEEAIGRKLVNKFDDLRKQADEEKWYKINAKKNLRNKADDIYDEADEHCGNAFTAKYNGRLASKAQN